MRFCPKSHPLNSPVSAVNEIPFHIFDYEPEYETDIRKHLVFLEQQIPKQFPDLSFEHVNLFEFLIRYLEGRNKFDKSLEMEERQGSEKTLKVPLSVANAESLAINILQMRC